MNYLLGALGYSSPLPWESLSCLCSYCFVVVLFLWVVLAVASLLCLCISCKKKRRQQIKKKHQLEISHIIIVNEWLSKFTPLLRWYYSYILLVNNVLSLLKFHMELLHEFYMLKYFRKRAFTGDHWNRLKINGYWGSCSYSTGRKNTKWVFFICLIFDTKNYPILVLAEGNI